MKLRLILFTISGAVIAFVANYFFIEQLIIPDPCYYHSRETTFLFDIFYSMPASAGDHPIPTIFNFIFTLMAGSFIGYKFGKWWREEKHKPKYCYKPSTHYKTKPCKSSSQHFYFASWYPNPLARRTAKFPCTSRDNITEQSTMQQKVTIHGVWAWDCKHC